MKLLFLSHSAMGGPFVVGSHHLARGLVAMGHEVLHMSVPVTPLHLARLRAPFERERVRRWWAGGTTIDGVQDKVPGGWLTWDAARALGTPADVYGRAFAASVRGQLGRARFLAPDAVFIDEPRMAHALDLIDTARIVYRPTDVYPEIRRDPSILDAERQIVRRAHAFVATSEPVAEHLRRLGAAKVQVIENGVDLAHFERGPDVDVSARLPPPPRAVYAGAFDHRFGIEPLQAAAARCPGVSFVMIGPCPASMQRAFASLANVHFLGPVPYAELPSYLRRCQLGLLPLSPDPSNEGRSPMKLFEYAAAGLPVLASTTAELRRRGLAFVTLAGSATGFAEGVERLVALPAEGRPDPRAEARAHGWAAKCAILLRAAGHAG